MIQLAIKAWGGEIKEEQTQQMNYLRQRQSEKEN